MKLNDDLIILEKHYCTSTDVSLYKGKSILITDSLKITLKRLSPCRKFDELTHPY